MLALARSVPAADHAMKEGRWEKKRFLGTELRGKTLGLAGLGRVGQEVAVRAHGFGMDHPGFAPDPGRYLRKEFRLLEGIAELGAEDW